MFVKITYSAMHKENSIQVIWNLIYSVSVSYISHFKPIFFPI